MLVVFAEVMLAVVGWEGADPGEVLGGGGDLGVHLAGEFAGEVGGFVGVVAGDDVGGEAVEAVVGDADVEGQAERAIGVHADDVGVVEAVGVEDVAVDAGEDFAAGDLEVVRGAAVPCVVAVARLPCGVDPPEGVGADAEPGEGGGDGGAGVVRVGLEADEIAAGAVVGGDALDLDGDVAVPGAAVKEAGAGVLRGRRGGGRRSRR